nr:isoleucine--tRNA ligase [Sphingomonadales bacterium]
MEKRYREHAKADWTSFQAEVTAFWETHQVFEQAVAEDGRPSKVFYEGPPSANGIPGIHHVMARAIKDLLCRYWTMQGYRVDRKSGWDTHGLPVELQVEKKLGIRREDIGQTVSIEDFNRHCREDVMQFTGKWEELTRLMGYWIDLDRPYVTYHNEYIESVWNLLQKLYNKGLLYKGFTIQPYSPAAGTGLSSHELNQPGTYRQVKDLSMVAQFRLEKDSAQQVLGMMAESGDTASADPAKVSMLGLPVFALAWTTTPWTLPSNTGLAVGSNIIYAVVRCVNPYTSTDQLVILAQDRVTSYFSSSEASSDAQAQLGSHILGHVQGFALQGLRYEALLPYARPEDGDPYRIVVGDFVSTEDGTGIVHLAPSFGADDFRVGKQNNLGNLTLVDRSGRFTAEVLDAEFPLQGYPVKEAFLTDDEKSQWLEIQRERLSAMISDQRKLLSADELIALKLKREGLAFRIEKYEHSYPHCWRTDKPILYYPLDSWFVKTTAVKDRMIALNREIQWKPESTGSGRFGNWLENLVDWNLSRSRYWGTPLPIWSTDDGLETRCIGSIEELREAIQEAKVAGIANPDSFHDLHRPEVDRLVLKSSTGKPMRRETDLVDVWFDSGAMPYAQNHFMFGKDDQGNASCPTNFPADFIAEGVDQTRGWFFTLHAIAVMLFDSVAFKSVISNGLVLDKDGNKMSKRLGNTVDPYLMLGKYGADALRWYMISNAPPWDNLKFDTKGVEEVQRKFFGTLYNTYQFWALYANLDGFTAVLPEGKGSAMGSASPLVTASLTEMDRWILSVLHSLIQEVDNAYAEMEPTRAARAIQDFTDMHLSNWYVRLSRRRFWKDGLSQDKAAAFQTLHQCLLTVAHLMAPLAPFYAEVLYSDLLGLGSSKAAVPSKAEPGSWPCSVHLSRMPQPAIDLISVDLEGRMEWTQAVCSLALSLRKKAGIRVRQPLSRLGLILPSGFTEESLSSMLDLIRSEVNIKSVVWAGGDSFRIQRKVRPNFRRLGPKYPTVIQQLGPALQAIPSEQVEEFLNNGFLELELDGVHVRLETEDLDVLTQDIKGWQVASEGAITVALDTALTPDLEREGLARELVNRVQKQRKDMGLDLTDRIVLHWETLPGMREVVEEFGAYIAGEVLADRLQPLVQTRETAIQVDLEGLILQIDVEKVEK